MNTKETALLIVDDDNDTRDLLPTILASALSVEHTCLAAANAQEAIRLLESSFFHLVLSDIQMPETSGIELCHHIRQNYPNTVVIMLSGMSEIQYAIDSMRAGAFDYLMKPVNLPALVESIERALRYQGVLLARHYCEQSIQEEVRDLLSLNERLQAIKYAESTKSAASTKDNSARGRSDAASAR